MHYGAAKSTKQLFADRITVVLDENAQWVLYYNQAATSFDPGGHPKQVLDDIKALKGL